MNDEKEEIEGLVENLSPVIEIFPQREPFPTILRQKTQSPIEEEVSRNNIPPCGALGLEIYNGKLFLVVYKGSETSDETIEEMAHQLMNAVVSCPSGPSKAGHIGLEVVTDFECSWEWN